jgi:hypothetical protein
MLASNHLSVRGALQVRDNDFWPAETAARGLSDLVLVLRYRHTNRVRGTGIQTRRRPAEDIGAR